MPIIKPEGLKGLRSFAELSDEEIQNFANQYGDLVGGHNNDYNYINNLYRNLQFLEKFGEDAFKNEPDRNARWKMYRDSVIEEEWAKLYSPNNFMTGIPDYSKGLGVDYNKYNQMSSDAKLKVLESDYLKPDEFEQKWEDIKRKAITEVPTWQKVLSIDPETGLNTSYTQENWEQDKQLNKESNQRILDHIYNDDVDAQARLLGDKVSEVYSESLLANLNSEQIEELFRKEIVPNSYEGNRGIPEFAAHYGDGSQESLEQGDMEDFTIEEMKEVLAKKMAYERFMSPEMAQTALNNDAKRYITEHQSSAKRASLFAKDVGISTLSYTADKVNGLFEPVRYGLDAAVGKPEVYVDQSGNIVNSNAVAKDADGNAVYIDSEGTAHPVHKTEIARSTLHLMGKDADGNPVGWVLNPQFWTRAEATGTLDENEQLKYEKLGSSPYKVSYNPNDDRDLMYESFKMMSFGIADNLSMLIPYGIGATGRIISGASNAGRVLQGLGNSLQWLGRMTSAASKPGQVLNGVLGAEGIAYAYERGAFQETLAKNLADLDTSLVSAAGREITDRYNTDEQFKKIVDAKTAEEVDTLKKEHLKSGEQIVDEEAFNEMVQHEAQTKVFQELLYNRIQSKKNEESYNQSVDEAIHSAGATAITSFAPEAVKYGLVNCVGFRKYLYSNPTAINAARNFTGLKEITTSAGRKRLATNASKFLTTKDKWLQGGKIVGRQMWGGAWTNGTDDMMVDAAERINEDSYSRYLNAYENGESIADLYGGADGLYSYMMGLYNSLGQETTTEAATVGALGSVVSATPNFANITSLATKSGREAFRNNFQVRNKRNEDGSVAKDEKGNPIQEEISWKDNWRDRAAFFIQNGVLSEYYGAKQSERDLQNHADYINSLLDDANDFQVIEDLITSDIENDNAENIGDEKTMRFIKAIQTMKALNNMANSVEDPSTLSSVVQNAKHLLDRASKMSFDANDENAFSEEEVNEMLNQYYRQHGNEVRNETNDQKALYNISQNAQELIQAAQEWDKAEKEIQKAEKTSGISVDEAVRNKLKLSYCLDTHWRNRVKTMQDEIGDNSDLGTVNLSSDVILAVAGGKKNSQSLIHVYDRQERELNENLAEQQGKLAEIQKRYSKAQEALDNAKESTDKYEAQEQMKSVTAELEDTKEQIEYLHSLINITKDKRTKIEQALSSLQEGSDVKVLTADEIFSLDPVSRATMLNPENRGNYSSQQQNEIEKLEKQLLIKNTDALQKIQDIALLSQRIKANMDSYYRISNNPTAAAHQVEIQRIHAAKAAEELINQRNAESVAGAIKQVLDSTVGHEEVTSKDKEEIVYRALRKIHPKILNIIDKNSLLPDFAKQVSDARDWSKYLDDIMHVVKGLEESPEDLASLWDDVNRIIESSTTKEQLMTALEKEVESMPKLDKVLEGLEKLDYQRDALVIEDRRQRKEREENIKREEEKAKENLAKELERLKKEQEEWKSKYELNKRTDVDLENSNAQAEEISEEADSKHAPESKSPAEEDREWGGNIPSEEAVTALQKAIEGKSTSFKKGSHTAVLSPQDENKTEVQMTEEEFNRSEALQEKIQKGVGSKRNILSEQVKLGKDIRERVKKEISGEDYSSLVENKYFKKQYNKQDNTPVNNNMTQNIIDMGDGTVSVESPSIKEQSMELPQNGSVEIQDANQLDNANTVNEGTDKSNNVRNNTLTGNAFNPYETEVKLGKDKNGKPIYKTNEDGSLYKPLSQEGKLIHKKGAEADDAMNRFYKWMEQTMGIKLQNIIDHELARILEANDQPVKIKFMATKVRNIQETPDVTDLNAMKNHLLLVVDYDNSINTDITTIHNEDNGGVVEALGQDGKKHKYLIVGVAGYGNAALNPERQALYDILFSKLYSYNNEKEGFAVIKQERRKFFKEHPDEDFYVSFNYSTEIVPESLIPGWIVRQTETDNTTEFRSITELLNDPARNPMNLNLSDLAWGIQTLQDFLIINRQGRDVMKPDDTLGNVGRVFVCIPAGNGKLVPAYIKPVKYSEIKDGNLKNKISEQLSKLSVVYGPKSYELRLAALKQLSQFVHLGKDSNNILLTKDGKKAIFVRGTVKVGEVDFTSDNAYENLLRVFESLNPRINITGNVLSNKDLIKEYDEAGALTTDVAYLHTAGSSYSIYAVDASGKMLKPEQVENQNTWTSNSRTKNTVSLFYNGKFFTYNYSTGQYIMENGNTVNDEKVKTSLYYNRLVLEDKVLPVKEDANFRYYNFGTGENPNIIAIKISSNEVKQVNPETAKEIIEAIQAKEEQKKREAAILEALADAENSNYEAQIEDVEGTDVSKEFDTDESSTTKQSPMKEASEEQAGIQPRTENMENIEGEPISKDKTGSTQTFETMVSNRKFKVQVLSAIAKHFADSPISSQNGSYTMKDISDFLRSKNIEVDNIGTTEEDVATWLKTLEECR